MIDESRQEITTIQYSESSATLFATAEVLESPYLRNHFEPIVDERNTLPATKERFESPFFTTDEIAREKLLDVVKLLTQYTTISKAMWSVEIEGAKYIFTFEEQLDETENLISVITYNLQEQKQIELEEFKISENVHMVKLQKTEQQVYIKSEADLHAEYATLKESGVKVSGYNVRLNEQGQIEAEFGGKWYKLEDVVVKDSEMHALLSQITKAVENGQTAFTVTTHGISAATSIKFGIKIESAEYIINIFDVANGRVYNYILVDKSIEQVQEILAKYGIELNLDNPDLTFGAVNNFNKEQFEKDNFGETTANNETSFVILDSDNEYSYQQEISVFPFHLDFERALENPPNEPQIQIPEVIFETTKVEPQVTNPEIILAQEVVLLVEDDPVEPKPPLVPLDKGLLIIVNTTETAMATVEQVNLVSTAGFEKDEATSTFGVDVAVIETAWNVITELLEEQDFEVVNLVKDIKNQSSREVTETIEIAEQVFLIETTKTISTPRVDIDNVTGISEFFEQEEVLVNIVRLSEENSQEKQENVAVENKQITTQTQNVDLIATKGSQAKTNNTSSTATQERSIAEQVILLQEQFQVVESEHIARHLSARVADFRWSNNLTEAEARAIKKDVEAKTGKQVIEIRTSPSGKLQIITI